MGLSIALVLAVGARSLVPGRLVGVAVEGTDAFLTSGDATLACRAWLGRFELAAVYSDTLAAPPPAFWEACPRAELVALESIEPGAGALCGSYVSAQLKRELVLRDVAARWRDEPPTWILSTEQDAWFFPPALLTYLAGLKAGVYPYVVAGAGRPGSRGRPGKPFGPFLISSWAFTDVVAKSAPQFRRARLKCVCPGGDPKGLAAAVAVTGGNALPAGCGAAATCATLVEAAERLPPDAAFDKCTAHCVDWTNAYEGGVFNNDDLFAFAHRVARAREDVKDSVTSCAAAGQHDACVWQGRALFWCNRHRLDVPAVLDLWPHRPVGAHRVPASDMARLTELATAAPSDPFATRAWPSAFVVGATAKQLGDPRCVGAPADAVVHTELVARRTNGAKGGGPRELTASVGGAAEFHLAAYLNRFRVSAACGAEAFVDVASEFPTAGSAKRLALRVMGLAPPATRSQARVVVVLASPLSLQQARYSLEGAGGRLNFDNFVSADARRPPEARGLGGLGREALVELFRYVERDRCFVASRDKALAPDGLRQLSAWAGFQPRATPTRARNAFNAPCRVVERLAGAYGNATSELVRYVNRKVDSPKPNWRRDDAEARRPPPEQPQFFGWSMPCRTAHGGFDSRFLGSAKAAAGGRGHGSLWPQRRGKTIKVPRGQSIPAGGRPAPRRKMGGEADIVWE